MNILDIADLRKSYPGGSEVLKCVDLHIPRGSITALLGLNGSGKSTIIRILLGLTKADTGVFRLSGKEFHPGDWRHKASLGAVLDEPLYFDMLTAREYLVLSAGLRGVDTKTAFRRTHELLPFLGLDSARDLQIRTFSTGMKKKISLAAAIIHRPPLLLLDEPFEGIDPLAARDIHEALTVMAASGCGVLVTSHILGVVDKVCRDIAVLHEGRIVFHSSAEDLRHTVDAVSHSAHEGPLERAFLSLVSGTVRKNPPEFLVE